MRQVLIHPGEDGYWIAECPSLPGCVSQGSTRDDAGANIKEAIAVYVEALEEDGLPVPPETFEAEKTATIMQIETMDQTNYNEAAARAIAELLCTVWPKPGRTVGMRVEKMRADWAAYKGPQRQRPRSIFIREDGRVIAHSGVDVRTIGTSQGNVTVLALARVCTDPNLRGKNLGAAVIRETFKLVDDGSFPWSLFQTSHKVRPFYEKLNACLVNNRIVNSLGEDKAKNPFWDEVVMRYSNKPGWPEGDIDLRGSGY